MRATSPDGGKTGTDVELLFNDLSIHGQFPDVAAFQGAIGRVMAMRELARRRYGRELQCHRNVAHAPVTRDSSMPQAIRGLSRNKRSALMQWLARSGPFWEDYRRHGGDDYLECKGEVVTDTAVGEAAHRLFHGIECGLVSMNPSSWLSSPLPVDWYEECESTRSIGVPNYWDAEALTAALDAAPISLASWRDLETAARGRCPDLTFSPTCFEPLRGHSFGAGAAQALLSRLTVLHDFKNCFDNRGQRTPEGHETYRKHFTGKKAWFSDSSDTEKADFRRDLTFPHPANAGETLFCTWHGKVKTPQLRIHFSWPVHAAEPLYVVYVGPKITKR